MEKSINIWLQNPTEDKIMMKELLELKKSKSQKLSKTFNEKLIFGTAGIRGVMGAGLSKINSHTVSAAAESFALYLKEKYKDVKNKFIIIANDNRHNGEHYKELTAQIMKKHGIDSYVLSNNMLMATPLLSFCIRRLKAIGGVNITASHNPKEYNGFKVYNNLGSQLLSKETSKITSFMSSLNFLNINKVDYKSKIIDSKIINEYIKEVSKISFYKTKNDKEKLKVVYSPMHGTGRIIGPRLLDKLNVDYKVVEKQSIIDKDFSDCKSPNPEDSSSYSKALKLARKNNSDIVIVTDPDADRVGAVVKYKKRWKYINGNQIASIYLDYYLSKLKKQNKLPKDGYIVKSNVSTSLASLIAKKYSIKVIETQVGFKNIANVIENSKGTFLFGFEESFGFLINSNISRDKDAFQGIVAIVDMAKTLKEQGKDIFSRLKELFKEYALVRNVQFSYKVSQEQLLNIPKIIKNTKNIESLEIKEFINYTKGKHKLGNCNMYKIIFKDNSTAIIRPSGTEPKIKLYVEIIGDKEQELIDITYKEKIISNFFTDKMEVLDLKKWSWKAFIKYSIFFLIVLGIMSFVFTYIYSRNISTEKIWTNSISFLRENRYKYLVMVLSCVLMSTLGAWIRKRLLTFQGQKVSWKQLIISSYMGSIISYITPFTIGGDAISYWYLRRKGFKRGPLLSSFIMSTIIYQIGTLVQTMLFIPIGLPIYEMIFNLSDPQSYASLIMFVTNLCWDIFATIMILSLTLGKTFQEWIVQKSIKLLEWFSFITISDPGYMSSRYQYEFREMRLGVHKLWNNKLIMIEVFLYEIFPKIFLVPAFIYMWLGVVKHDLPLGQYWSQVIAYDLVTTSNSMSITPGGSGTAEWLNMTVNQHLYLPIGKGSSQNTAIYLDVINKVIFAWPMLLVSSLLIPTIIIGEKRTRLYELKNRYNNIKNKKTSNFYKLISIPWIIFISIWISFIILI